MKFRVRCLALNPFYLIESIGLRLLPNCGALLLALLLALFFSGSGHAQSITGTTSNGLYYRAEKGRITITGHAFGLRGTVSIPASVMVSGSSLPVRTIGTAAFYYSGEITRVVIPGSVTRIEDSAFFQSGLTSVTLPASVMSIGGGAFAQSYGLKSVTISNGVRSIGNSAFAECGSLTRVEIPASVERIDLFAFADCVSLAAIDVDPRNPNYSSLDGALYDKDQNTLIQFPGHQDGDFTVPEGVTRIGDYAFYGCENLNSVTIPGSVTSIGVCAFFLCDRLVGVAMNEGLNSIGMGAFALCFSLTEVRIPDSVTSLGVAAFCGCENLASVTIPDRITSIGGSTFYGCWQLTDVSLPGGLTSIGDFSFYECSGLTSITIPEGVTRIGNCAFIGCSGLTSLTIPGKVSQIGVAAFQDCRQIPSVTIPGSVTKISNSAFLGCSHLSGVTIQRGVAQIDAYAFMDCRSLGRISLPRSVIGIGTGAFLGCASLSAITVDGANPGFSSIGGVLFDKSLRTLVLFPPGKAGSYTIPEGVTSIGDNAFLYCGKLTDVMISRGVTCIGNSSFAWCGNLANVAIASSVTRIRDYAFSNCESLRSAIFMGNSPAMGNEVFSGESSFTAYYFDGAEGFENPTGYTAVKQEGQGLMVILTPSAAANSGAQWQLDGGPWQNSGEAVRNLWPGSHSLAFKAVPGWATPAPQIVMVSATQMLSFVENYVTFDSQSGEFTGLLSDGSGWIRLDLARSGNFTAKLRICGQSYSLSGAFNASGDYRITIGSPAITLALHIDPTRLAGNPGDILLTGSAGGSELLGYQKVTDKGQRASQSGLYTILLLPTSAEAPQGSGYARMTVSSAGMVRMSGKLADNTSFSASGPLVDGPDGNQFFVYNQCLYGGKGLLSGALTFGSLAGGNCDGSLRWFNPGQRRGGSFNAGFDTDLAIAGARYLKPSVDQPALPFATGTLTLSGGVLATPIAEPVTLLPGNTVRVEGVNSEKLKINLHPASGLITGSFVNPTTKQTLSFGGVIIQNVAAPQAGGFFLGPIRSDSGGIGNVSLTP